MKIRAAIVLLSFVLAIVLMMAAPRMWDGIQLTTGWALPDRVGPPLLIIGHHGDLSVYPENTAEGIWSAAARNPDGVEIDLQRSASGTWFVIHDATLDRTTDRSGKVSDLADETIESAVIQGGLGYKPNADVEFHVPRLETVMAGLSAFRGTIYLDLQHLESGDVAPLLELTEGMRVAIICPSPAAASAVKALGPGVETIVRVGYSATPAIDGLIGNAALQPSPRLMATWSRPLTVYVAESQFDEDEYSLIRLAWASGVKAFMTNHLEAALAIRDGFEKAAP